MFIVFRLAHDNIPFQLLMYYCPTNLVHRKILVIIIITIYRLQVVR